MQKVLVALLKNKWFWYAVGALALIWIGYRLYRNFTKVRIRGSQLPNGGQGLPSGWKPDPLARELHTVLDGWHGWSWMVGKDADRDEAVQKFADLPTDDMFSSVVIFFEKEYGKGETLRQWLLEETGISKNPLDMALSRMDRLSL